MQRRVLQSLASAWRSARRFAMDTLLSGARAALRRSPWNVSFVYRVMRSIYHLVPVPLERKRHWADRLLSAVPALRLAGIDGHRDSAVDQILRNQPLCKLSLRGPLRKPMPKPRILVVDHCIPTPDRTSSSMRMASILQLIAREDWEITFVSDADIDRYRWILANPERELPHYEQMILSLGAVILYGWNAAVAHLANQREPYLLAFLSYPEIMHKYAPLVRAYMPTAELAYDTVDLHWLRFSREARIKRDGEQLLEKAALYQRMETANFASADKVVAISNDERREIIKVAPTADVVVLPNIHRSTASFPEPHGRSGLLFIGHYLHTPNEDAVVYFINDILPRIEARIGKVDFSLLGSSMTEAIRRLKSDHVHPIGYVKDLDAHFHRARVFVAPLRYGAGMKGKVGQSLSYGLPVVTTSIGAEGMGLENQKHVLIADDSQSFADAVVRLYTDFELWQQLSARGMQHIQENFSADAVAPILRSMLVEAVDNAEWDRRALEIKNLFLSTPPQHA